MSERRDTIGKIEEAAWGRNFQNDHNYNTPLLKLTINDDFGTFHKELGMFDGGLEAIAFMRRQGCDVSDLVGRNIKVYEISSWGFIHEDEFDWNDKDAKAQLRKLRREFPDYLADEYHSMINDEIETRHRLLVKMKQKYDEASQIECEGYDIVNYRLNLR